MGERREDGGEKWIDSGMEQIENGKGTEGREKWVRGEKMEGKEKWIKKRARKVKMKRTVTEED